MPSINSLIKAIKNEETTKIDLYSISEIREKKGIFNGNSLK